MLPARQRWNFLFQKYVTKTLELHPPQLHARLENCRRHLEHFTVPSGHPPRSAFEIGTGWFPVVPLGLWLCGVDEVWTYDIEPLLSRASLQRTLSEVAKAAACGLLPQVLPAFRTDRLRQLRELAEAPARGTVKEVLAGINIHPQVRGAENSGLPPNTVDLFFSTGVFEYIPRSVLTSILRESLRVGTARCLHSHYINLEDQYSTFDRSITPFNFLKYTERQWRWLDSPIASQNRLRISDFREIFAEVGLQILKEQNAKGSSADIETIRLAPRFRHYRAEDLLVVNTWLVARRS